MNIIVIIISFINIITITIIYSSYLIFYLKCGTMINKGSARPS